MHPKISQIPGRKSHGTETSRKFFRKFGYTSRGYANLQFPLACSFGRDHLEFDMSRKDDGDAYSMKETL